MKWVTGPAGCGKTAIMGAVAQRLKKKKIPVLTFFFSAMGSPGRRNKDAFIPTITHQLAHYQQDLKGAVASAIEDDPVIFKKNLRTQLDTLILGPLRAIPGHSRAKLQGVIVVDGLDECEVD